MIKVSTYALTTALLAHPRGASAACSGTFSSFTGTCDYASFVAGLQGGCTEAEAVALFDDAPKDVAALCKYDAPVQFVEIQGTYQKDRRYFAGGGNLVDGADWSVDTAQIRRFEDNLADSTLISFPDYDARLDYNNNTGRGENGYPANMNLASSCELQTVMCCFTDDTKMDGSTFADNGDSTTDVCRHEHHASPESNHIERGWSVMPGPETSTHCVGFTWKDGEDQLIGNMMYDISLQNSINKGYVKGIPSAPMCGCVEHMPVVEEADCRTASGSVTFEFTVDAEGAVSASNTASITYSNCAEADLAAQVKADTGSDAIDAHLVGNGGCVADVENYLNNEEFLQEASSLVGTRYEVPDPAVWGEAFVGKGVWFLPPHKDYAAADAEFRALIDAGCQDADGNPRKCMVRRICTSCQKSHRDIVYQRLTPLPPAGTDAAAGERNFLHYFLSDWQKHANEMGTDFALYSSESDARAGTGEWEWCNYDYHQNNVGFPYECGVKYRTWGNWNSYTRVDGHATHHGFWVEKAP